MKNRIIKNLILRNAQMANKMNMGIGVVIIVLIAAYFGIDLKQQHNPSHQTLDQSVSKTEILPNSHLDKTINSNPVNVAAENDEDKIRQAFIDQRSNIQVQSSGRVKAILRDDNEGSRHQKFILELKHGLTVLVAHNIDLSPRLKKKKKGEIVEFYGEYEYSHQGGVLHWTHHDPQKKHADGGLKYKGRTDQ